MRGIRESPCRLLKPIVFYDEIIRVSVLQLSAELFRLDAIRKIPNDQTIILYTPNYFDMHGDLLLVGMFEVVGKSHEVDEFLITANLYTESFGIETRHVQAVEFFVVYPYMIDRLEWIACFTVAGIHHFNAHIRESIADEAKFLGR